MRLLHPGREAPPEDAPIVGSLRESQLAAQKLDGRTWARCASCKERTLLTVAQVSEYGRRPTARVLCLTCGDALQRARSPGRGDTDSPRTPPTLADAFEFDPPHVGAEVEAGRLPDAGGAALYEWSNDTGAVVVVTRKSDGISTLVQGGDTVRLTVTVPPWPA